MAERDNVVLQEQILEMKEREEQRMTEREEQRMVRQSPSVGTISQHGSNLRQHMSPRSEELGETNCQHVQGEEDYGYPDNENYFDEEPDEANQQVAAPAALSAMNITTSPRNDDRQHFSHDALAGNEVILYAKTDAMAEPEKVAKGIVVSTNPNNKLAGEALGRRFCEVIVDVVLKRDTLLPRPYAEFQTLGDAEKMPIAWPYNNLKVCSKQPTSSQGAAGSSRGATGSFQRFSRGESSQGVAGSLKRKSSQGVPRSSQRL